MTVSIWGKGKSSKALAKVLNVKRNIPADIVIRWRADAPTAGNIRFILNGTEAVSKSSDKLKSLKIMKEAGLNVPPFSERLQELNPQVGDSIFGRFRYHSKGADIVVAKYSENGVKYFLPQTGETIAKEQFLSKEYFVKWLASRSEYRYHVAFGKVILCTKKLLADESLPKPHYIRNHQNGKWTQVTCEETPRFSAACIKAIEAHGLDFGAVDFLNVNREPVMLEINTAPGLEVENRLELYSKAIKEHIAKLTTRRT